MTCIHTWLILPLLLASILGLEARSAERELLSDTEFKRGFELLAAESGKRVAMTSLQTARDAEKPAWEIAQWFTKWPALPADAKRLPSGALGWENRAKAIIVERTETGQEELALTIRGSAEFGETVRSGNAPWPHLLVEQSIANPPSLAQLTSLRLQMACRLDSSQLNAASLYDPARHAAQFLLYLHVSNTDRNSREYGHYLHFGVPLYDNRHRFPSEYFAPDTGGTGMVIYAPAATEYTEASSHDANWVAIDRDILPLIRRGLERAWKTGVLTATQDPGSYRVTFITFGWELPGNLDATMRIRGLKLTATER